MLFISPLAHPPAGQKSFAVRLRRSPTLLNCFTGRSCPVLESNGPATSRFACNHGVDRGHFILAVRSAQEGGACRFPTSSSSSASSGRSSWRSLVSLGG